MTGTNAAAAMTAWEGSPPDWVKVLAAECDRVGSQRKVADALRYSPAVINQVLRNHYGNGRGGDLEKVAETVRGRYMGKTVDCPIAEQIPRHKCISFQDWPVDAISTNPFRVQLYRACRAGCPHALPRSGGSNDQ